MLRGIIKYRYSIIIEESGKETSKVLTEGIKYGSFYGQSIIILRQSLSFLDASEVLSCRYKQGIQIRFFQQH